MHSVDDLITCLADFNRHVGWNINRFGGVHGAYGLHENVLGTILLVFFLKKDLCVSNRLFKRKRGR